MGTCGWGSGAASGAQRQLALCHACPRLASHSPRNGWGAEPCRAAPKELSVQWEDREVGSTVSWGLRRGPLPEQRPLRQKGLGSEGPAEGRAGAQKGLGAPLKGTSFLSGLRSHTITHTLTAQ